VSSAKIRKNLKIEYVKQGREMSDEVKIPEIGESITSGILTTWLKEEGEAVSEGDDLFELETDKASLAIPSPSSGVLHIQVEADTEVSVGQVVATLDAKAKVPEPTASSQTPSESPQMAQQPSTAPEPVAPTNEKMPLSPAVRRLVEEHSLDPTTISGTGKDGRLTKADVLQAIEKQASAAAPARTEQTPSLAVPSTDRSQRQTREKMTSIRRRIAERLVQSKQSSAHLTTFNEIDMQRVIDMRSQYRDSFEKKHGIRLGFMSFFVKACCQALKAFPVVNAMIEGEEIVYNHFYDIGVAVSTDRGLIVPVIRDADGKSFAEIESQIVSFVTRAKEKKLTVDELVGGTFSITNGGVFGSLLSTPIPNPPQTAILGMHAIQKRAVVIDDIIEVRPMMYVALSYDHRLIDGRDAVRFLVKVKQFVEDPQQIMLEL
jgi:2-oxoglutarate dehydrogenase E2 component (dihydrolipoamide succinyltransferase)